MPHHTQLVLRCKFCISIGTNVLEICVQTQVHDGVYWNVTNVFTCISSSSSKVQIKLPTIYTRAQIFFFAFASLCFIYLSTTRSWVFFGCNFFLRRQVYAQRLNSFEFVFSPARYCFLWSIFHRISIQYAVKLMRYHKK